MGRVPDARGPEDVSTDRDVTTPWESDQREMLRATFDQDAEAYDRSRPVAPDDVFDEALRLASLAPGSMVVEIGPGTGQATRQLAARGLQVVAVELGPQLAERARRNLAAFPHVDIVTASFETWDPGRARFDAVFACNSFHWIDPVIRFAKAAAVLRAGGHLVVLATPWVVPETADRFWWDVQDDWAAVRSHFYPSRRHPHLIRDDLASAVRASGVFDEPTTTRRTFEVTFTAEGYATNLSTQSGIKELPEHARAELIAHIRQRVEDQGGRVTAHLLAMLTVARRARTPL